MSFADGDSSATISVDISGDTDIEPNEGFVVTLFNPSVAANIATPSALGNIRNDDASVEIAATDAVRVEGDSGTTEFTFTVRRVGEISQAASVEYAVTGTGGAPVDAADFGGTLPSGIVNFAPGEATQVVRFDVTGDTDFELDEDFLVTLSNPSAGTFITSDTAAGQIINDDPPEVTLEVDTTLIAENGGPATITARLADVAPTDVTVDLVLSGTATESDGVNPNDYNQVTRQIFIAAGDLTGSVQVQAVVDAIREDDETVIVDIDNVTGANESVPQQVTVTIQDSNPEPVVTLSVNSNEIAEAVAGTTTVTASLDTPSDQDVTINLSIDALNSTATETDDFTLTPQTLTIPAGEDFRHRDADGRC